METIQTIQIRQNNYVSIPISVDWNKQNYDLRINASIFAWIIVDYFKKILSNDKIKIWYDWNYDQQDILIYFYIDNKTFSISCGDIEVRNGILFLFQKSWIYKMICEIFENMKKKWLYNYNQKQIFIEFNSNSINKFIKKLKNLIID